MIAGGAEVTLLDYGAGNVRSVRNAIHLLGFKTRDVTSQLLYFTVVWFMSL